MIVRAMFARVRMIVGCVRSMQSGVDVIRAMLMLV